MDYHFNSPLKVLTLVPISGAYLLQREIKADPWFRDPANSRRYFFKLVDPTICSYHRLIVEIEDIVDQLQIDVLVIRADEQVVQ